MRLDELIAGLGAEVRGDPRVEIGGLAYSSDLAGPGSLFFCVPGFSRDGHDFAPAAVDAGAAALVVARELDLDVPQVVVADVRRSMAPVAARFHGDPTARLSVAGITGTNGKTTTAFLLRGLLEIAGRETGLLGTVKRVAGGVEEEVERTTPEAIDLQAALRRMLDAGDSACVMEVSSHALVLHRADAIHFAAAVFTNLTRDHLDFHADMEDYFQAKRLLFAMDVGARVVNIDDPHGRRLADEFGGLTYSVAGAGADYTAEAVDFDVSGARFRCSGPEGTVDARIPLPGHFNVANALAALATAEVMGIPLAEGAKALAGASRVPGRMEPVDEGQPFAVLVDYAHTPDSLDNVLRAARKLAGGRLICVFGCGGDRDRGKRPLMGRVAAELSDLAVVTSDNPRGEGPEAIIGEILEGSGRDGVEVEPDRRAAIALALEAAGDGDLVVIAGKGHEQGQELEAGRTVPFDDRDVARDELRRLEGLAAESPA